MNTLHLNLRKQWFEMIFLGIKKEEYREIKPFWFSRLFKDGHTNTKIRKGACIGLNNENSATWFNYKNGYYFEFIDFETITFSNGYSRDRPQFEIEFKGIEIREGNLKWGAEPGKKYFVLNLGEVLSSVNCEEFILKNIE